MKQIVTTSASRGVSEVNDILIREGDTSRMILRPILLDNAGNPDACVKGAIIYQKKNKNGEYKEDDKAFSLTNVKKGQYCKIDLKSEEVLKILNEFNTLKELYAKYGFNFGEHSYFITEEDLEGVLTEVSKFQDKSKLLEALRKIDKEDISKLASIVSLSKIENILEIWSQNKTNSSESFWQTIFKENSWVLSQIFACPYICIENTPFAGGKDISNKGGVQSDFLMKQANSDNIAFVEIKTPTEKIMYESLYRGENDDDRNSIYPLHKEVSGGINQTLNQITVFAEKKIAAEGEARDYKNPKGVLIVGRVQELSPGQKRSFDLFRHNSPNLEIIAYDELFERIELLRNIFLDN